MCSSIYEAGHTFNQVYRKLLSDFGLEAVLKTLLGFKVEAGPSVQSEEYTKYFEDWTFGPNKGFDPEKVF
jgi:hypothetical protein